MSAPVSSTNPDSSSPRSLFQLEIDGFSADSSSEADAPRATYYGGSIGYGRLRDNVLGFLDIGWTASAFVNAADGPKKFAGLETSFVGRLPWTRHITLFEGSEVLTPFAAVGADIVFGHGPNADDSTAVNFGGSAEVGVEFFSLGHSTRVSLPFSVKAVRGLHGLGYDSINGGLRIDW